MPDQLTNSWSFPNCFDVARNRVAIMEGNASVVNRSRLLILTEPTELYNEPEFGVGLKQHLWQYNTSNTKAIIQDRIKDQLRVYEPCVEADQTSFADGLLFTSDQESNNLLVNQMQSLRMTVGLSTKFQDRLDVSIDLTQAQLEMFGNQEG